MIETLSKKDKADGTSTSADLTKALDVILPADKGVDETKVKELAASMDLEQAEAFHKITEAFKKDLEKLENS